MPIALDTVAKGKEIDKVRAQLANSETEFSSAERTARRLAKSLIDTPSSAVPADMDPYTFAAMQQGAANILLALDERNETVSRRRIRLALEQLRQALRDYHEDQPVAPERDPREIARWLVDTLEVPRSALAEVIGVSLRTYQRWISDSAGVKPKADEETRLRAVARIANHLRHGLSGAGVVSWFFRPFPELEGRRPADFLSQPDRMPELLRLASRSRSFNAS